MECTIIIIMEICNVPTLWLKALNKHNALTHVMYITMEDVNCYPQFKTMYKVHARARAHTHTHTHTHTFCLSVSVSHSLSLSLSHTHTYTHIVQTDWGEGQCCLTEIFGEEKCLEFAFEGKESSRVPDGVDCSRCVD